MAYKVPNKQVYVLDENNKVPLQSLIREKTIQSNPRSVQVLISM